MRLFVRSLRLLAGDALAIALALALAMIAAAEPLAQWVFG